MRRGQFGGKGRRMGRGRRWTSRPISGYETGSSQPRQGDMTTLPGSSINSDDGVTDELEALKKSTEQIKIQLQRVNSQLQELDSARPSPRAVVNRQECAGCGICVEVCPVGAIVLEDFAVVGPGCTGCGRCVSVCPNGAIRLE